MNYKPIILVSLAIILVSPRISDAALFRDCELSSSCGISTVLGKNVEINILAENTQTSSQTQRLELGWSSTNGGIVKFQDSGTSFLDINLLPREKKIYKAILSASETGDHFLSLSTDGAVTNVIEVRVGSSPEFSEMGLFIPILFIILSVIIYSAIAKS